MGELSPILTGIGILAAIVILGLLAAIVLFVARFAREFGKLSSLANQPGPPARIHLEHTSGTTWHNQTALEATLAKVRELGFADLGTFTVSEMPGVLLRGLLKSEESVVCIIYEHPQVGQWVDFAIDYEDGSAITVSNAPSGHELEQPPNKLKIYDKSASVNDLYEILRKRKSALPPRVIEATPEAFITMVETAYKEEMDWRNAQGAPSEETIREIAKNAGIEVDDPVVEFQRMLSEQHALEGLRVALEEQFRSSQGKQSGQGTDDAKWNEYAANLVFIHDKMSREIIQSYLQPVSGDKLFRDPETQEALDTLSARQAFFILNARLSQATRFKKVGEVKAPIEADVYEISSIAHART